MGRWKGDGGAGVCVREGEGEGGGVWGGVGDG